MHPTKLQMKLLGGSLFLVAAAVADNPPLPYESVSVERDDPALTPYCRNA